MISRRKLLLTALAAPAAAAAAQMVPAAPSLQDEIRKWSASVPKCLGSFEVKLDKLLKQYGENWVQKIPGPKNRVSITTMFQHTLDGKLVRRKDTINCFSRESVQFMMDVVHAKWVA